jgi:hypothetical protein
LVEGHGNVLAQRRAPRLPALSQATDVSAGAEFNILASK